MDEELRTRFETLEKKVDATYQAAEKAKKYFQWILILTLAALLLPLLGLLFAIPSFLSVYSSIGNM